MDNMEKREFAQRLSELRIQKGLSARDMSLSLGLGESYINNVENCQNYPSMVVFFAICDFLNISPHDFFDTETKNPTQAHRLLELCKTLPEEQVWHLIALATDLQK